MSVSRMFGWSVCHKFPSITFNYHPYLKGQRRICGCMLCGRGVAEPVTSHVAGRVGRGVGGEVVLGVGHVVSGCQARQTKHQQH